MSDTSLIRRFRSDPEQGYSDLLDQYTPIILRMIRRFINDTDEVMETYTAICERFRSNNFQALRRFRANKELTPWLSVVVANACRDRFRKNRMTSAPKSVISKLKKREKLVFKYFYQEHMPQQDIAEVVSTRDGIKCDLTDVVSDLEKIDKLLSVNKRWHLLAALRANRPALSLDDMLEAGIHPVERALSVDDDSDPVEFERVSMLNEAITDLDPEDQLLVLLRFEHGMRAQQIATVMQFENHKYVYTRLRTIVSRLRRTLESIEA